MTKDEELFVDEIVYYLAKKGYEFLQNKDNIQELTFDFKIKKKEGKNNDYKTLHD